MRLKEMNKCLMLVAGAPSSCTCWRCSLAWTPSRNSRKCNNCCQSITSKKWRSTPPKYTKSRAGLPRNLKPWSTNISALLTNEDSPWHIVPDPVCSYVSAFQPEQKWECALCTVETLPQTMWIDNKKQRVPFFLLPRRYPVMKELLGGAPPIV